MYLKIETHGGASILTICLDTFYVALLRKDKCSMQLINLCSLKNLLLFEQYLPILPSPQFNS